MDINIWLKILRWISWIICLAAVIFTIVLFYQLLSGQESLSLSDTVLIITALFIALSSVETKAIIELTRAKERPFLEIVFPSNDLIFKNKVGLKNLGQSPAYSPGIKSIEIEKDRFDFDPLETSRLPIQPNESREVWVHHIRSTDKGSISVGNVFPVLEQQVFEYYKKQPVSPLKIEIYYFDNLGIKCKRDLYIKVGGIGEKKYIYTSTSPE